MQQWTHPVRGMDDIRWGEEEGSGQRWRCDRRRAACGDRGIKVRPRSAGLISQAV